MTAGGGNRPTVVVTRRLPAPVEERLAQEFAARLNGDDHPFTNAELQAGLRSADALLPTVTDRISAEVLAVEPLRARILANFGVGFNHIDVTAAKVRGLVVTNTPEALRPTTRAAVSSRPIGGSIPTVTESPPSSAVANSTVSSAGSISGSNR